MYKRLALPDCMGDMDGTDIFWDKCTYSLRHLCRGKDGFTCVGFNVIGSLTGLILNCSNSFYGGKNDKQKVVHHEHTANVIRGLFKNIIFYVRNLDGRWIRVKGG